VFCLTLEFMMRLKDRLLSRKLACVFIKNMFLQIIFVLKAFFEQKCEVFKQHFRSSLVNRKSYALVLKKLLNFGKSRSIVWFTRPALHDQVEHLLRADIDWWPVGQEMEAVRVEPVLQVLDDLVLVQVGQGLLGAEGEQLPQRHAERPDVTLRRPKSLKKNHIYKYKYMFKEIRKLKCTFNVTFPIELNLIFDLSLT